MKRLGTLALHLCATAFLGLLLPACGGDNDHDENVNPGGSSSPTPLFSEDFGKAFPGTAWSSPFMAGGGAAVQVDTAEGNPAPSLAMTSTSGGSFVGTTTTMSFASRPSTFSVQMSAAGTGEGSGGIAILDPAGVSVAAAEWHAATPSALTFRILGTTNASPVAVPLSGSGFHTFTFTVDAAGNATWRVDASTVMSLSGFPSDTMRVQLYDNIASGGASFATFRFDNVTVSSP
jgi:hypothetical protein